MVGLASATLKKCNKSIVIVDLQVFICLWKFKFAHGLKNILKLISCAHRYSNDSISSKPCCFILKYHPFRLQYKSIDLYSNLWILFLKIYY